MSSVNMTQVRTASNVVGSNEGYFGFWGFANFFQNSSFWKPCIQQFQIEKGLSVLKIWQFFFCNKALSLMSQELCVIRLFEIIKTLNQSSNITKFPPKITQFGLWWSNSLKISLFWSIRLLRSKTWVYRIWRLSRNLIFIVQNRQKLRNEKIDF